MKSKTPSPRFPRLLLGALMPLLTIGASHATVLVYEGFTGYTGPTLSGSSPNSNTVGLNTAVNYVGGADDGPGGYTLGAGLTFGNLLTSGQSVTFNSTPANSVASAQMALSSSYTGTLYSSYLVRLTGKGSAAGNGFEVRVSNDDASGGARFRTFADTRTGTSNVPGVDYQGTSTDGITDSTGPVLSNGQTYLIVGSFTRAGQGLSTGNPSVGTMYAFTSAQFDFMMSQSDPTAYLNALSASSIGTGNDQISAFATESVTSSTYSFANGNRMQFVNVKDGGTIDEIRFGSDFLSVVPLIPEPGSSAMVAASLALLALRRKR